MKKRNTPLLITAVTTLLLGAVEAIPPANPPLCYVQATYRPLSWPSWVLPERRFRQITVSLRPGCSEYGIARIRFVNGASGRILPESGYYVLVKQYPSITFPIGLPGAGAMNTWRIEWLSSSGTPYVVKQIEEGGDKDGRRLFTAPLGEHGYNNYFVGSLMGDLTWFK